MTDLPTTRADWSSIGRTVRRTLARPRFLVLATFATLCVATLISITRRLSFVADALVAAELPLGLKAELLLLHVPFVGPWPGGVPDVAALLVAVVAGITAATLGRAVVEDGDGSVAGERRDAGLVLGTLAVVVAALGPGILAGVAGLGGADGVLASLPLSGLELSVLAVPAMLLAIHWVVGEAEESTGV